MKINPMKSTQLLCAVILLWYVSMVAAQPIDTKALNQEVSAFMSQYHQQDLTEANLDALELQSQDLIKRLKNCENLAEEEINQLVEIRVIDALQSDTEIDSNNEQEIPIQTATMEVDNRINEVTKNLISCRISSKKLQGARIEIIAKMQNQWVSGLTKKQPVWQFTGGFDLTEMQTVFPVTAGYILVVALGLFLYLVMVNRLGQSLFDFSTKKISQVNLKTYALMLLKLFVIPLLLAGGYYWLSDQHNSHVLVLFLGMLARDACLFLPVKFNPLTGHDKTFKKYLWVSTSFLLLFSFAWNELFLQSNAGTGLLDEHAVIITPIFLVICVLLAWSAWQFMKLTTTGLDRFVTKSVQAAAVLSFFGYAFSYAGGAKYLLVLAAGMLMVLWVFKTVNALRKVLLTKSIKKLKAKEDYEDATFSFPLWVTVILFMSSGIAGLIFLSWLGGVSEEVFKQAAFIFNEGFDIGSVSLVPRDFLIGLIIFMILLSILNKVKLGIQTSWFNKSRLRKSTREVYSMLVWYIGVTIAVFLGLSFAGFDISKLAIIAGALSVGIGFGLQNIVSNFVSGLILLFERPVTRGDWVEVGDTVGLIEKVKIRATRIRTFDNAEILVPNSELLSNHVTNWTLSNEIGRITVKVGVAYGSDVEKVRQILNDIAHNHDQVMQREPYKHKVLFRAFGDSSLNFELRVMIKQIKLFLDVEADLNFAIEKGLREANISIPFPQRDIHIKNSSVLQLDTDQSDSKTAEAAPEEAKPPEPPKAAKQSPDLDSENQAKKSEVEQMIEEDEKRKEKEEKEAKEKQNQTPDE